MSLYWLSVGYIFLLVWYWYPTNEPVSKYLLHYRFLLADAWLLCPWLVMLVATCFITGSCLLVWYWYPTNVLVSKYLLHYRFVLAGAWLLVTGACCITGSCLGGACLCDTDTLRINLYRSAYWCLVAVFWFLGINITVSYYAKRCIMLIFNNL